MPEQAPQPEWDEGRARDAIAAIAAATAGAVAGAEGLALHPLDHDHEDEHRRFESMYLGRAGAIFALDWLSRQDLADTPADLARLAVRAVERYRAAPDFPDDPRPDPSLWMGETGILLVAHRLTGEPAFADRLAGLIASNVDDERLELNWGQAGTMLAADAMAARTGEPRFDELWITTADRLLAALQDEPATGCRAWRQQLYGRSEYLLGPAHGFAGNVLALARRRELLGTERAAALDRDAAATFRRTAVVDGALANWPPSVGGPLERKGQGIRVQWCHGAPGMVASLAAVALDDRDHTSLLEAGAELTWRTGPLAKGPGLCHGTAGNGLAFLAVFGRTGDERWLVRARVFAMLAIAQSEAHRATYGTGRHTLWTGDPGVALYLAMCIDGLTGLPALEDLA